MSRLRAYSSPDLLPSTNLDGHDEFTLEGVAANVKLLLKLIQDHNDASREDHDGRRPQRVAGMLTIIDDVRSRIEKSHVSTTRAELRRCNTELRRGHPPRDNRQIGHESAPAASGDENEKLRRELSASITARKALEKMFSGLGKEKEMIASELARKVQELNDMEEHVNDLRAQNEMLSEKVKAYANAAKSKERKNGVSDGGDGHGGNAALQERNKALSEQLLKSLDCYRSAKRKLKDMQEENVRREAKMAEVAAAVAVGVQRMRGLRGNVVGGGQGVAGMEKEIDKVEQMLSGLQAKVSKCSNPKEKMAGDSPPADKGSVLAGDED